MCGLRLRNKKDDIVACCSGAKCTNKANRLNNCRSRSNASSASSRSTTSRFSGSKGSSLSKVLSRADSFADSPDLIDLTEETALKVNIKYPPPSIDFQINENDFDDDDNIDLDEEYDLPPSKPKVDAAPPQKSMAPPPSPYELPKLSTAKKQFMPPSSGQRVPSSAATWSSSSPSHRATPPGALKRRIDQTEAIQELPEETATAPPRKRRTLPWAQKQAEKDEVKARIEEEDEDLGSDSDVSTTLICFRCKKAGHDAKRCPEKPRNNLSNYTPLPKDLPEKHMPWNTTGSAMAEEKRKFREKQRAKKLEAAGIEPHAAQSKNKTSNIHAAPVTLSGEQQRVLDLVVRQTKSVFFTGSAGTGKSVLMRAIIAELRKKYVKEPDRVAVTASTGLAACNIGGVTLHSFGGIGLGKEDIPTLCKKIKKNQKAKNRWIRTKILVIDEISMVDGDLFDKLEGIARSIRNNGRPFGGIQLVITGDFFQLPPVPDQDNKSRGAKFAFEATTWSTAIHHTIGLTEVFRQKDPGRFRCLYKP